MVGWYFIRHPTRSGSRGDPGARACFSLISAASRSPMTRCGSRQRFTAVVTISSPGDAGGRLHAEQLEPGPTWTFGASRISERSIRRHPGGCPHSGCGAGAVGHGLAAEPERHRCRNRQSRPRLALPPRGACAILIARGGNEDVEDGVGRMHAVAEGFPGPLGRPRGPQGGPPPWGGGLPRPRRARRSAPRSRCRPSLGCLCDQNRMGWQPGCLCDQNRMGWQPGCLCDQNRMGWQPGCLCDPDRTGWLADHREGPPLSTLGRACGAPARAMPAGSMIGQEANHPISGGDAARRPRRERPGGLPSDLWKRRGQEAAEGLERRAVPECPWFAGQHRHVVPLPRLLAPVPILDLLRRRSLRLLARLDRRRSGHGRRPGDARRQHWPPGLPS